MNGNQNQTKKLKHLKTENQIDCENKMYDDEKTMKKWTCTRTSNADMFIIQRSKRNCMNIFCVTKKTEPKITTWEKWFEWMKLEKETETIELCECVCVWVEIKEKNKARNNKMDVRRYEW